MIDFDSSTLTKYDLYLLAPFWSDIDYSEEGSISYRVYQSGNDAVHDSVIEEATQLSISHANADTNFKALAVIVATWSEVVPWGYKTGDMERNTFQAAMVTNYEQTYTLYGYNCGDMSWSGSPAYPTSPVIGFNAGGVLNANHRFSYQPNSHEIACRLSMNFTLTIVGYRISLNLDEINPAELACIRWFSNDLTINSHLPVTAASAFPCPCNFFQAIVDARYRYDFVARSTGIYNFNVDCFVSRFSVSGNFQRCCYDFSSDSNSASFLSSLELTPVINSGNQRGSILSSNPVFYPSESYQEYKERDEEGYVQCCSLSNKCDLFYRRRPSQNCDRYVFRPFTWGFGDPHVISMDGFMYTFNGIGEYWYLFPVEQCDFQVQTRTQPIRDTEATVFTSIAVRINNCSTVFVSLLGRDDLSLFVDQQNRTDDIHSSKEIMDDCVNIEYFPPNGTDKPEIKIVYKNGAFLNVRANTDLISMNFSLPDSCRDRTSGLIGQWDGDISNDLLMRNGTLLSQNVTDREKEEFADSWRITQDESFMVYEMETYATNNPNTAPFIYLDEFIEDANITTEIQALCNGNQICLFDAVVTNDTSVAMGTIFISEESEETVRVGNNIPPLIQTPLLLFLSLDNLTTFEFNVTDEDEFSVNYALSPQSVFTDILLHNLTQSVFELQLRLIHIPDSMNMTIIANDSIGVSLVSVYVVVCHCENGGYCSDNPSGTDSVGDSGYIRSSCQCPLGYEGVYCSDIILDPCLQSVCEVETCPAGTEKNDNSLRCEDFDECETECLESTRICQNTYGSYICTCALGYEEAGEECIDVNECSFILSPCQQQCNNIIGSFVCDCDTGYALQPDGSTCKAVSNTFLCPAGYSCQDNECTSLADNLVCSYCESGTQLSSEGTYCVDLDECTLQAGICPYPSSTCVNAQPLYFCQCNQGYDADSQGVCVDINECISASPVCGELELCINNPGSYMCVSNCYRNGMVVMNGDICKDITPIDNTTTPRVPVNEEVIAITFNLSLSALTSILKDNNSSLTDMYSALAALLETPLMKIDIVETVGSEGMLVLLLMSTNFQVEPRFTVGLLQSSMNQHWKPFYVFVTNVTISEVNITLRGNFNVKSILIIGICTSISLTLLLLCLASLWILYNTMGIRQTTHSAPEPSVTRPKLSVLHGTRAVIQAGLRTSSPDSLSNMVIQSNNITLSKLSSYTCPNMEYESNSEFDLLSNTLHTFEDIPPACELKNRFTNILPPPHSRVPLFLKYGLPNSDYINANFIRGYNKVPRVYIATQAPMFSTEQDFWRMVWEQNVGTIIMLTEIIEQGREQCFPYWPDYDTINSLVSGEIVILARSKLVKEDYQICTFILRHRGIDEVHEVSHYWYRKWPEYGVPDNPNSLVTLLLETRTEPRTSSHPVLVHCASGTGRTGVVLAVDIGMHELEEKRSVDILRNVSLLRQDRGGLIQTREQYHFLYKTICAYARYLNKRGEEMN
ncbi:Mucin-like protein [Oopsacas minuta]|uniref:Mucin-like protein n=1 Tax=Oopsacas minuta TaxID=111878 RepID=A0AAV7JBA4_9METZ|nr:Mucin-like protein [Oopsacas minuta]